MVNYETMDKTKTSPTKNFIQYARDLHSLLGAFITMLLKQQPWPVICFSIRFIKAKTTLHVCKQFNLRKMITSRTNKRNDFTVDSKEFSSHWTQVISDKAHRWIRRSDFIFTFENQTSYMYVLYAGNDSKYYNSPGGLTLSCYTTVMSWISGSISS